MRTVFPNQLTALSFDTSGNTLGVASSAGQVYVLHTNAPGLPDALDEPLVGHRGEVWGVAFRPNPNKNRENQIATAGSDGKVILWHPTPPEPLQVVRPIGHTEPVTAVALNVAGTKLASVGANGQALLWDINTRKHMALPIVKDTAVLALAFSPAQDKQWLAGIDSRGEVALWNLASPERREDPLRPRLVEALDSRTAGVVFSPDGAFLAGWSKNNPTVLLWKMGTEKPQELPLPAGSFVLALGLAREEPPAGGKPRSIPVALIRHPDEMNRPGCKVARWDVAESPKLPSLFTIGAEAEVLAVSPDGRRIAVGTVLGEIHLRTFGDWNNSRALTRPGRHTAHTDQIESLAFTPDGKWLVSGSSDGRVGRWNVETGAGNVYRGHGNVVRSVSVAAHAERAVVASGSDDTTVRLWEFPAGAGDPRPLIGDRLPQGRVQTIGFQRAAGSRILAVALDTGAVVFWDVARREQVGRIESAHRGAVTDLAFAPARWLATSGADGKVYRWDATNLAAVTKQGEFPAEWDSGVPASVAFSPDGALLAAAGTNDRVILWDTTTLARQGAPSPASGTGVLPLTQQLALWDVARDRRQYFELTNRLNLSETVAFRPGGGLAVNMIDNSIRFFETPSNVPVAKPLTEATGRIRALAFNPTKPLLAAGGADNLIRFWDTHTIPPKALPLVVREHERAVETLAFSPDGRLMASAETTETGGGVVYLWRVDVRDAPDESDRRVRVLLLGKARSTAGGINSLAFDHDSKTLAWSTTEGEIGILDVWLDNWKDRARVRANRDLLPEERARYNLPNTPVEPR